MSKWKYTNVANELIIINEKHTLNERTKQKQKNLRIQLANTI